MLAILLLATNLISAQAHAAPDDPHKYDASCQKNESANDEIPLYNQWLLQSAKKMPAGQGYSGKDERILALAKAANGATVDPTQAGQSFCSAGVYMVLMDMLKTHQRELGLSNFTPMEVKSKAEQPDGSGIWGRVNANGPGVAVLFNELHLGTTRSLANIGEARPGDIMKMYWNDKIGEDDAAKTSESGHVGIFDSIRECGGVQSICFWGWNTWNDTSTPGDGYPPPGKHLGKNPGWGLKCMAQSKFSSHTLFSRLEKPQNFAHPEAAMGLNQVLNDIGRKRMMDDNEYTNLVFGSSKASVSNLAGGTARRN